MRGTRRRSATRTPRTTSRSSTSGSSPSAKSTSPQWTSRRRGRRPRHRAPAGMVRGMDRDPGHRSRTPRGGLADRGAGNRRGGGRNHGGAARLDDGGRCRWRLDVRGKRSLVGGAVTQRRDLHPRLQLADVTVSAPSTASKHRCQTPRGRGPAAVVARIDRRRLARRPVDPWQSACTSPKSILRWKSCIPNAQFPLQSTHERTLHQAFPGAGADTSRH